MAGPVNDASQHSSWKDGFTSSIIKSVDPAKVEALLARELNSMAVDEREALYEEIHGVQKDVEETEEFLKERLHLLECELQRLVVSGRAGIYTKALETTTKSYVASRKFHLMFLRAEYYDPHKAARRMILFLERKVKFFGEKTLARPIRLSDLDRDDMACLKAGTLQLLPARDRSGRAILADLNMNACKFQSIDNMIKAFLYVICAAAEDEETQRSGLCTIFYFSTAMRLAYELHEREPDMLQFIPLQIKGIHFCSNDPGMKIVKALFLLAFGKQHRAKVRFHEGTHTEVQYGLMAFGIPIEALPVTYEGELKTNNHLKWISRRHIKEGAVSHSSDESSFRGVDLPGPRDVLLGRGKTVQDHCGNFWLRNVMEPYVEVYKKTAKLEKNTLAMQVVIQIKKSGGRFLKRPSEHGWWVEVDDEMAREKVSMIFRATIASMGRDHSDKRFMETSSGKRPRINPDKICSCIDGDSSVNRNRAPVLV